MELSDAENILFERMSVPRESSQLHLSSLDFAPPKSFSEVAAVGLDTNVLKMMRRELQAADQLVLTIAESGVDVIAPGQSIIEFWNNHKAFASDDWNAFRNAFQALTKKIDSGTLGSQQAEAIGQIRELVDGMSQDLHEEKSPEYLDNSRSLVQLVLARASKPMVSRPRFAQVAQIRQASKYPPGFADDRLKVSSYGDFFVWCDFLLGALCVALQESRRKFVWVTEDSKPDWKTGGEGHPALLEEFHWVHGGELWLTNYSGLKALLDASETPRAVAPGADS